MKKHLKISIVILIYCMSIICCKKSDFTVGTSEGKNPLVQKSLTAFKIVGFNETSSDFNPNSFVNNSISVDSLKNVFGAINCWVFRVDSITGDKSYVHSITQKNSDSNFGQVQDSLPFGKYVFYFGGVGLTANLAADENAFNDTIDSYFLPAPFNIFLDYDNQPDYPFISYTRNDGLEDRSIDFFDTFASDSLEVNVNGSSQSISVNLNRKVGKLKVKIMDATADMHFAVQLHTQIEDRKLAAAYLFRGDSATTNYLWDFPDYDILKNSFNEFETYQPLTDIPFSIVISLYSDSTHSELVETKTVNNIVCKKNQLTLLTGNFFSNSGSSGNENSFTINLDPKWSTDTIKTSF